MTQRRFFRANPQELRNLLQKSFAKAEQVHNAEEELLEVLRLIDADRIYTKLGYNSLRGFCMRALKFTHQQSQRLATRVRHPHAAFGRISTPG